MGKLRILISYRPGFKEAGIELWQNPDGTWTDGKDTVPFHKSPSITQDIVERCVTALRKNSVFEHELILLLDTDIHPRREWLDKLGVTLFQPEVTAGNRVRRTMGTTYECLQTIPDGEWVCYAYIADLVCGKGWDKHIFDAIKECGKDYVYVPMWVEPRTAGYTHTHLRGEAARPFVKPLGNTSAKKIWGEWRAGCCHSLTMLPPLNRDYAIERDLDRWSAICNSAKVNNVIEPCGTRDYGYYAAIVGKSEKFKKHSGKLFSIAVAPDLAFEGALGMKVVVTKSHVFHLHYDCVLEAS